LASSSADARSDASVAVTKLRLSLVNPLNQVAQHRPLGLRLREHGTKHLRTKPIRRGESNFFQHDGQHLDRRGVVRISIGGDLLVI